MRLMAPLTALTSLASTRLTSACSSVMESTPAPSLDEAAMVDSTLLRLSAVTPVMPSAAKSSALSVGAGDGTLSSAARLAMAPVVLAKVSILATVLTSLTFRLPMASFSRARPDAPKPAAVVAPMAV